MAFPHNLYSRITRKRPRRDYNTLNNGIDSHFPPRHDKVDPSNSSSPYPLPSDTPSPSNKPILSSHALMFSDKPVPSKSAL